jgi:TonB family protein
MKKYFYLTIVTLLIINNAFAQNHPLKRLNEFKFVYMLPLMYDGGKEDIYGIMAMVKARIEKSGMKVILGTAPIQANPDIQNCEILTCEVGHGDLNNSYLTKKDSVTIRFFDCYDNIIYHFSEKTKGLQSSPTNSYRETTAKLLHVFEGYYYRNVKGEQYTTAIPDPNRSTLPAFPGGLKKLEEYIYAVLKYPKSAKKDRIAGTVDLSFVIDKRGFVKNVLVRNGLREDLDNEAKRVIESLPRWIAGMENGKPIDKKVIYSITYATKQRPNSDKVDY